MVYKKPTDYIDENLAEMLGEKISAVDDSFDKDVFQKKTSTALPGKTLKQRMGLMADQHLPDDYTEAIELLTQILGPENEEETGMVSMTAIGEITKRNTGEYAVRPFIRKYPEQTLSRMQTWAVSENFHLRRLASEGLRPKLPCSQSHHRLPEGEFRSSK